jgi:hypothetical protein
MISKLFTSLFSSRWQLWASMHCIRKLGSGFEWQDFWVVLVMNRLSFCL